MPLATCRTACGICCPPHPVCLSMPAICHLPVPHTAPRYVSQISTQKSIWKQIGKWDRRCLVLVSVLGSIKPSRLRVCQGVQLRVHLRQCLGVYFRIPSELTSKGSARQAVYVLSSAIGSVFESTRGSTLENELQCVLWSILGVYFKPSWEVTCENVAN
jgi:hypothetical protein